MGYTYMSIVSAKFSEVSSRISSRLGEISSRTGIQFGGLLENERRKVQSGALDIPAAEYNGGTFSSEPSMSKYDDMIDDLSERYGIDPALVRAVMKNESDYDADAVSEAGAMGLMQLMPATADGLGISDPFDPAQNIEGGIKVLMSNIIRYNGDVKMALAAYNMGRNGLATRGVSDLSDSGQFSRLPEETRNYITKISAELESSGYGSLLIDNFFTKELF